jgi:hypothetical protein
MNLPNRSSIAGSACLFAVCLTLAGKVAIAGTMPPGPAVENWQSLLSTHVRLNGGVDYQGFQKDEKLLDAFLLTYKNYSPAGVSEARKKADYINLYNAGMIKLVLRYSAEKHIDLASPQFLALDVHGIEVPGGNIWNGDYRIAFAGKQLNLDDIEHKLLRGQKPGDLQPYVVKDLDPRIHAAVNCGAFSCPRVREKAYLEATVDTLLEENIKEYLSSNQQFSKVSDSKMAANSIVFWYYPDFDDHAQKKLKLPGAGSYLSQFIGAESPDRDWKIKHLKENFDNRSRVALKLSSAFDFRYQWQVNDVRNKKDVTN